MDIYLIGMGLILVIGVYNAGQIAKLREEVYDLMHFAEERFSAPVADERAEEEDSSDAEAIEKRNAAFAARIERIKSELALQQKPARETGYSAQELHPSVKNLPHNIIAQEHMNLPDVEYAD